MRGVAVALSVVALAACGGGDGDGGGPPAEGGQAAAEQAFAKSYRSSWVTACKAAIADIRKTHPKRVAGVTCTRPVEQMEGNTSFDPAVAAEEGRHQGTFDGCAYVWDEAYKTGGEVEPRC